MLDLLSNFAVFKNEHHKYTTKKTNKKRTNKKTCTNMKTCIEYTLNVYKAEYNEFQLRYIRENYTVITETDNVLTIAGEQTELENIMENCFASDEKFKESFPEYITKKERELQTLVKLNALKSQIQTVLLEAIKDDCADSEIFHKFQEFYIHEFVNKD